MNDTLDKPLKELIRDCFKRTLIQTEGDTELFDTELTIDNLVALFDTEIHRAMHEARIDELDRLLPEGKHFAADSSENIFRSIISHRLAQLTTEGKK